jgi:hypothetical protein
MQRRVVANVWWESQVDAALSRMVFSDAPLTFGRHSEAAIRIGHGVDYDPTVPRWWGELSWHRDRLHVANLDDNWGFDLVPEGDEAATRMTVAPQSSVSPPMSKFDVVAEAPSSRHVLHIRTSVLRPYPLPPQRELHERVDPPSHLPFRLSDAQRSVGKAVLAGNQAGRSRRVGYDEIGAETHYSRRYVRELVHDMDSLFLLYGLAPGEEGSDALDRISQVFVRHSGILR